MKRYYHIILSDRFFFFLFITIILLIVFVYIYIFIIYTMVPIRIQQTKALSIQNIVMIFENILN